MIGILLLYYFLYVYSAIFIVYVTVQIFKRKKLPLLLLFGEIASIAIFFYLQYLVDEHRLIFTGKYENGSEHWGAGLANVYISFANEGVLLLIFIVTQIVFWYFFNRQFKQLNVPDLTKDLFQKTD